MKHALMFLATEALLAACDKKLDAVAPAPTSALVAPAVATSSDTLVKIGHGAPTSGPIAHLGQDNQNGARHDAGIPQVSPSATHPKYTGQGFKTAFSLVADDALLGGTLGKYAVGTLNARSIAVIDDRTAYGQSVAEEITKAVLAAGGKVVADEFTTDRATDFSAVLTT